MEVFQIPVAQVYFVNPDYLQQILKLPFLRCKNLTLRGLVTYPNIARSHRPRTQAYFQNSLFFKWAQLQYYNFKEEFKKKSDASLF